MKFEYRKQKSRGERNQKTKVSNKQEKFSSGWTPDLQDSRKVLEFPIPGLRREDKKYDKELSLEKRIKANLMLSNGEGSFRGFEHPLDFSILFSMALMQQVNCKRMDFTGLPQEGRYHIRQPWGVQYSPRWIPSNKSSRMWEDIPGRLAHSSKAGRMNQRLTIPNAEAE